MIRTKLLMIIADISKKNASEVSAELSIKDLEIDSLGLLNLRETIERSFNQYLKDNTWFEFISENKTILDLAKYLESSNDVKQPEQTCLESQVNKVTLSSSDSVNLLQNGIMTTSIEVGMPLTGRNKLAEGPLLQRLGDLRWTHMCRLAGVKSKNIIDENGNRLYPTFFYVEISFSEKYPMAHFGENDKLHVVGDLKRFGTSMLDGRFYLFPEGMQPDTKVVNISDSEVSGIGMPTVRLSNIFVMQFSGAEWLKKSRPVNSGFEEIPEIFEPPSCYGWIKSAESEIMSFVPPSSYIPLTNGPVCFDYNLVPDRDLNGAGLVYFANYPVFLDICERKLLESSRYQFDDKLINNRTLINRRSGYFNNASASDTLEIEITAFLENPFNPRNKFPELAPIRLFFNYRMFRKSDKRLMMASTASKIIYGITAEELSCFDELRSIKAPI